MFPNTDRTLAAIQNAGAIALRIRTNAQRLVSQDLAVISTTMNQSLVALLQKIRQLVNEERTKSQCRMLSTSLIMLDAEYHLELLCPFTSLMRIYPTPSVSAYLVEMVPAIQAGTLSQEDASALLGIHIHRAVVMEQLIYDQEARTNQIQASLTSNNDIVDVAQTTYAQLVGDVAFMSGILHELRNHVRLTHTNMQAAQLAPSMQALLTRAGGLVVDMYRWLDLALITLAMQLAAV